MLFTWDYWNFVHQSQSVVVLGDTTILSKYRDTHFWRYQYRWSNDTFRYRDTRKYRDTAAILAKWPTSFLFTRAQQLVQFVCISDFYRAKHNASAVFGIVILSVCLSVLHTRALWRNYRTYSRYFDTKSKGNHSSFLIPTEIGGQCSLPPEICA